MLPPEGIVKVGQWEEHCRRIHARANDLLDGRLNFIEAARLLCKLAAWTHGESDPDLSIFRAIDSETMFLPAGPERAYWAKHALEPEDVKIRAAEQKWKQEALAAASRLVKKYAWALEARRKRRSAGTRRRTDA